MRRSSRQDDGVHELHQPRPVGPSSTELGVAVAAGAATAHQHPPGGQRGRAPDGCRARPSRRTTPTIAPASGNTKNAQSCFIASVPENTAAPKLRAGFTDVLSTGIVARWIIVSVKPAARPPKPVGYPTVVVDSTTKTSSAVKTISTTAVEPRPNLAADVGAPSVRGEDAGRVEVAPLDDDPDDEATEQRRRQAARSSRRPLAHDDLPAEEEAERDGRVDVAAGHVADRVRHAEQREAERERDAVVADLVARDDRAAGADDHQHRGADELRTGDAEVRLCRSVTGCSWGHSFLGSQRSRSWSTTSMRCSPRAGAGRRCSSGRGSRRPARRPAAYRPPSSRR